MRPFALPSFQFAAPVFWTPAGVYILRDLVPHGREAIKAA